MSIPFRNNIDLGGNQVLNAALQVLATDPGTPYTGQFWFNSTTKVFKFYDGTTIHSGANLDTPLSSLAVPTAAISLNNQNITNVADPVNPQDAVNLRYAQGMQVGIDVRNTCYCGTTTALPTNTYSAGVITASANGALSIDGQSPAVAARVLIKNEATAANNGIYVVAQAGDASHPFILTRASDFNSSTNIISGAFTLLEFGTTNGGSGWVLSTSGTITVGTTALTFIQFTGASGTIAVANGGTGATTAAGARTNLGATTKYATTIGDGTSTSIAVTHSLGTQDVIVQCYNLSSPYDYTIVEVQNTSTTVVTLVFATAPAANSYRVIVIG